MPLRRSQSWESLGSALAGPGGTGITATPAANKTWAGHTATFVRSASGIINETNRVNLDPAGPQNPWTSADVYLQFRPPTGPNGPAARRRTRRATRTDSSAAVHLHERPDPSIAGHRLRVTSSDRTRTTCVSTLVNPQVASGTIDSSRVRRYDGYPADQPRGHSGSTCPARTPTATSTSPMPSTRARRQLADATAGLRRWPVRPRRRLRGCAG